MKKTFWQKAISVCLALLMIPALIPAQLVISASAADAIPYIYRYWDGVNVVSETKQCESYTNVNGISSYLSGWYVINSSVSIENRLTVYGTANLILCDGVKLYLYNGINVSYGNTLNIYCQSGGSGGTVTIYGGTVKAPAENTVQASAAVTMTTKTQTAVL